MVASLKGSLKQTFNAIGAGSDKELQADVRSSFGIWTVDPGQVIANEITREQEEELTAGEADASLPVEQRDRNEQVNEKTVVEQAYELPEPTELEGENARQLETKKHNLSLQPDGLEKAGLMQNSNAAVNTGYKSDIEKQRKEQQFQNLLIRLQEQRRGLIKQIGEIQQQIDKLNDEIGEHSRRAKLMEQFMEELREGKVKLDENGYPVNPQYAALAKEFEQRSKRKFDADDPELVIIMEGMKVGENRAIEIKGQERQDKIEEQEKYIDRLEQTDGYIKKLESGE